jgi:hypothetical protein
MSEPLQEGILTSRGEFHEAIRGALRLAADQGCRELFLSDATFADWPLAERAVIEDLTRWAYAHRKLTLLAQNFDEFPRRHVRWVEWRRQWSHVVECRSMAEAEPGQIPSMLLAQGVVTVRLLDADHYRASVSTTPADGIRARDQLDAILQRSEEAFPVTMLGL